MHYGHAPRMHYLCLMALPEKKQEAAEGDTPAESGRMEYIVLGVLLFAALMAFPAFRDIQKLQDFVIAICAGG
jgi:hypothetical protein